MGYGEEVNTSDFDSDIRGFDSHYPCSFVYVFVFVGSNPTCPVRGLLGSPDIRLSSSFHPHSGKLLRAVTRLVRV